MKFYCSKCGTITDENTAGVLINRINRKGYLRKDLKPEEKKLCQKCTRELLMWFDDGAKKNTENSIDIIEMRDKGMTYAKIGKKLGLSPQQVRYRYLAQISDVIKPVTDTGKVWALRRAGWNMKQIAEEMKTSVSNIAEVLRNARVS